ncbi:MAG TPA: hypothetical protein P5329_14545 [Candidatus Competibacteraceae bacterium]|nr:hypothetical protein [Candidatus Competibacteraceae bacterium]
MIFPASFLEARNVPRPRWILEPIYACGGTHAMRLDTCEKWR